MPPAGPVAAVALGLAGRRGVRPGAFFRLGFRAGFPVGLGDDSGGAAGSCDDGGCDPVLPFLPPTAVEVFSVRAPKSNFRRRRIVVFLSPTNSAR